MRDCIHVTAARCKLARARARADSLAFHDRMTFDKPRFKKCRSAHRIILSSTRRWRTCKVHARQHDARAPCDHEPNALCVISTRLAPVK